MKGHFQSYRNISKTIKYNLQTLRDNKILLGIYCQSFRKCVVINKLYKQTYRNTKSKIINLYQSLRDCNVYIGFKYYSTYLLKIKSTPHKQQKLEQLPPKGMFILKKGEVRALGVRLTNDLLGSSFMGGCVIYDRSGNEIESPESYVNKEQRSLFVYLDTSGYNTDEHYVAKFYAHIDEKILVKDVKFKVEK